MATPFKIAVDDVELQNLKAKLALTRFPDELDGAEWAYGVPLNEVKRLVEHWKSGYDWRKEEERINSSLPQYRQDVDIEGYGTLNIHFVHHKSSVKNAIPLLIVHGWPGSFLEVTKILSLLTNPPDNDAPAFHVVAPSLPGYGWSQGAGTRGFGISKYAETCHKLMLSLGYKEYVAQGGDWGAAIGIALAKQYGPSSCKAFHRSNVVLRPPTFTAAPLAWLQDKLTPLSDDERSRLYRTAAFVQKGLGYFALQTTKPQTLGYSLADSPVGLLAWVYEKLHDWSDNYPWTDDEILTWVSTYWFSRSGPAASVRIYYEYAQTGSLEQFTQPIYHVPIGVSAFLGDFSYGRKMWRKAFGNVVFEKEHENGGHFAAYEKPELLANDLREMFGKSGPGFQLIEGAAGY